MFLAVQESSRSSTGSLNQAGGGGFCLLLQTEVSSSLAKSIPILQICRGRKAKARGSRRAVLLHSSRLFLPSKDGLPQLLGCVSTILIPVSSEVLN